MKALTSPGICAVAYVAAALGAAGVTAAMDNGILSGIAHLHHGGIPVGALAAVFAGNLALAALVAIQHARRHPA